MSAPEIGESIGNYRILEKIGEGGMGAVYLAEDVKLNRRLALKFLPPEMATNDERLKRFEREAKTVAALNHPNIVTIYSVEELDGVPFIAMELVDGEPLGRVIPPDGLPVDKLFDLAIPLVDAIRAAHRRGINHRDLKPQNIMVTKEGRVKVLDFGLAKLLKEPSAAEPTQLSTQSLTQDGSALGTVSYMAPEQLKGKPPDERADIFALGIVLYQMASGKKPFLGDTSAEVISSILRDAPEPVTELRLELPSHLGRIVNRCLEKNPNRRYQSASELHSDLTGLKREIDSGTVFEHDAKTAILQVRKRTHRRKWILAAVAGMILLAAIGALWSTLRPPAEGPSATATAAQAQQLIAVLPLRSIGPSADAYFAEGMAEELSARLTKLAGVQVVSRASSTEATASGLSPSEIGRSLGADYLVQGTVRWAETEDQTQLPRVRATLQIVRVEDDIQVWSESFDRSLEQPIQTQTELAERLAAEFGTAVLGRTERPLPNGSEETADLREETTPTETPQPPAPTIASDRPLPAATGTAPPETAPQKRELVSEGGGIRATDNERQVESESLTIELVSFVATGRLTLFADDLEVVNESFEFPKRRRIFGSKKPNGKLILERTVPRTTEDLRIHLVVGNETRLTTVATDFSTSTDSKLTITVDKKGPPVTVLE